jgi:hypothetical protein
MDVQAMDAKALVGDAIAAFEERSQSAEQFRRLTIVLGIPADRLA